MQRQDYTVAYANRKVRNLYGETESRLCYEVFAGRKKPCLICPTFEVFETGQPVEWEFIDHKGRTFRIYDYPFEDETGEPLVMELGMDVTDLKRVEKELFQAQKLRAIGVLAGGMAHDLNNNLVPIIFNIDHVLNKTTDERTREPLAEALHAAYRAARLVEQVLEYSCRQDVSRTALHLTPLLRESIEMFRSALPETITLEVDLDNMQSDCVYANPAQMQQVILNLLRNAEQAIPAGGVVSLALAKEAEPSRGTTPHPGLAPGEYITLRVQDTGVGIQAEDIDRIFEPFFTTKKSKRGTGMGLAVVHSIVSSSGGAIKVDSIPGMGAAFTVYLPKAHHPAEQVSGAPSEIDGGTGRLLLVDDNHGALSAMARTLREAGFDLDTAHSGEEGIAKFVKAPHRYNLVLADQSMPGVSGMEMSAQMLAIDEDARIIICAGHLEPAFKKHARDAGIAGFAMKPMTPSTLVKMVQKHCR
jgi:signal transduction histidine kinase